VPERAKLPLLASLACLVAVGLLALAAYSLGPLERFDARSLVHLSLTLESRPYRVADHLVRLADPLPLLAMLAVLCGCALALGRRREAIAAAAVVAGANVTTQLLKGLLAHPRFQPYAEFHQPWPDAFPSGHATAAASIAVALVLAAPSRIRPAAAGLAAAYAGAVGLAVVALEWHYPSDVVGGFLVASAWGFAAVAALRVAAPASPAPRAQASSRFAISTK
jgi:membrane-associated phospholipid phosphatase